MKHVAYVIDGLGGNAAVARMIGLKPSAVSEMKRRNSVPPKYWPALIRLAASADLEGVNADSLMAVHAGEIAEAAA